MNWRTNTSQIRTVSETAVRRKVRQRGFRQKLTDKSAVAKMMLATLIKKLIV